MATYYPPVGFHFKVEFGLDGLTDADTRWQGVAGLASELGTESYDEGGENRFSHTLPGRAKHGNLVLKRGMFVDSKVIEWVRAAVEDFEFEPTWINVSLLDEARDPLMTWSFDMAYPVKWTVSDLGAQENNLVIETIEFAYQRQRPV